MRSRVPIIILLFIPFLLFFSCDEATISAKNLKKLIEEGTVFVVDNRWADEFAEGHLPTAVNIQPYQIRDIVRFLPKEKGRALVFYCRGYG